MKIDNFVCYYEEDDLVIKIGTRKARAEFDGPDPLAERLCKRLHKAIPNVAAAMAQAAARALGPDFQVEILDGRRVIARSAAKD